MVDKYIILADSDNVEPFVIPRQLIKINGESLIERTIRLLKENGIDDIIVTSHDKRFDNLGAIRYEPLYNDYKPKQNKGYWISAFPIELLNEPVCFLFGDVYYSENAIRTIINEKTDNILYFCSYKNKDKRYIKHHDEPFAFKVVDYISFKKHIKRVKWLKDQGKARREPIAWELYRNINGQDINKHIMTNNYIAINDETCDIDTISDIILLNKELGGNFMIKVEVIEEFTLGEFDKLKNLVRNKKEEKGRLFVGDVFECTKEMCDYLTGKNMKGKVVVKILEVIPEAKIEQTPIEKEEKKTTKKATKKKTSKK